MYCLLQISSLILFEFFQTLTLSIYRFMFFTKKDLLHKNAEITVKTFCNVLNEQGTILFV